MVSRGHVVLTVDDDPEVAEAHTRMLEDLGAHPLTVTDPERVEGTLDQHPDIEMVLLDVRMPRLSGFELLQRIKLRRPDVGVVMATVVNDIELAVHAIKAGAYNYLLKPLQSERVERILESFFSNRPRVLRSDPRFSPFITGCPSLEPVFERIQSFAQADVTVLVQGETGTGKEIVARLIHALGPVSRGAFVPVNMAGLTPHLLESQLFGHRRGAFTGAIADNDGFFEAASRGTLFLDEIGELPIDQQAKLLRVLQSRTYTRVGDTQENDVRARVVVATNRDLREEVKAERFREDLYYRLCSHAITLPPLRERAEDVDLLSGYFLRKYSSQYGRTVDAFHPEALALLKAYPFPGNVRELEGIVSAAVLIERGPAIDPSSLPAHVRTPGDEGRDLGSLKRRTYLRVLAECGGNQTRAAEKLGISRGTLNRWLSQLRESDGG